MKVENKKWISVSVYSMSIHLISLILILLLPNVSSDLFAWRPPGLDVPVVVVSLLIIMLISGVFGLFKGYTLIKDGVRKWWFVLLLSISTLTMILVLLFFLGEVLTPH